MAKKIDIGGELHSVATDHKVADALEIKDISKGNKSQTDFNNDIDRHEVEIHGTGGIDSRLTDIEQIEQIVLDGGEAQIAQGSDFTNPDATKRAKIPTVGAIVDGLNDGVYDVSKRNPTAGPNSDGKFTLDYILNQNNVNTLIPTGWRHGGMTISFVRTSDNKYIQAICTANTFTTDVTQWQGVDDEPAAGSDNLIKSGGVADLLSIFDIEKEEQTISVFQPGQGITWSTGVKDFYSNMNVANVITLNKNEGIILTASVPTNIAAIASNFNSGGWGSPSTPLVQGRGNEVSSYYYIATEDNTYIQLSYKTTSEYHAYKISSEVIKNLASLINTNSDKIENLKNSREISSLEIEIGKALNTNGTTYTAPNRATTGILLNEAPMLVYVPKGWYVSYMVGDTNTSLTDKGYIINDGEFTIISDTNKYIGFNIRRADSSNIDQNENIALVAVKNGTALSSVTKELYSIQDKTIFDIKLEAGAWNTSGNRYPRTNARSANIMQYTHPLFVQCSKGYSIHLMHGNAINSFTDAGYIVTDGGYATVDISANYVAFSIIKVDGSTFSVTDNCGFICTGELSPIASIAKTATDNKTHSNLLVNSLKTDMITENIPLTDVSIKLAISDGYDISEDGILYAGCCGAKNGVREHDYPQWDGYLLVANLADVEKTKRCIKCFPAGRTTWGGIYNGEIESVQNVIAKVTGEDEVSVIAKLTFRTIETVQYGAYVCRKYTPSIDTFDDDVTILSINVMGTNYEMKTKSNLVDGSWVVDSKSVAEIEAIWQATDIEHPTGYSRQNTYTYYLGQNPKKYDGYWYIPICLGNFSHALCKTSDMVNWEFVCDIPFNQSTEEATVCFIETKIYATSRGNYLTDSQYSKIMSCDVGELDGNHWSAPIVLTDCKLERPTIESLNNKLYMMQGVGNTVTDGKTIARGHKRLFVLDANMNILTQDDLFFKYPVLHPQFYRFGGNLWMVTSCDKRCFAYTFNGDARSEIAFKHLNEKILEL